MVSTKQDRDFTAIRAIFPARSEPLSLDAIAAALVPPIAERTLTRRLVALVARGDLIKTGVSRGARYRLSVQETEAAAVPAPVTVPLSTEARDILKLVTRPIGARTPVGFKRAFLDGYRPNETSYLCVAEKRRLAELSRTSDIPGQPAGTHAQRILNRLLIDLAWNSSRLEGNTYSLLDTERLIEAGEAAAGKAPVDAQMILNHKAAIEFLVQNAEDITFDRHTILNLHALLAENLLPDPLAAGRVRRMAVGIGQSVYHPPAMPQVLDECFDQVLASASAIRDPFEQSLFVMVQLPYLQPFEDVNKRVSRLAANIPLIRRNLSPISFVDVPHDTYTRGILGVYELNRVDLLKDVFLWAYERSAVRYAAIQQTIGEPDPFRLRHRQALREIVAEVIRAPMGKAAAAAHVAAWSKTQLATTDVARFIETAESELLGLHEGNYARYRIRPSEYATWRVVWEAPRTPPQTMTTDKRPKAKPRK
jgi:fido (protein-threonine AMPylation protein)